MNRIVLVASLAFSLSGCIVGTAVGVTKDIVVGTVDIATDVVGTAVDIVVPGKKKKR
jgi:predicted small secreted protein